MRRMRRLVRNLLVLSALIPAACGGQRPTPTLPNSSASTLASASTAQASASSNADAAGIVWLCKPGLADNPCASDLNATVIDRSGKATIELAEVAKDPPIDCFYVYPTTSRQKTMNANLSIDPEEKGVAVSQAAIFSEVCNVYAPIYPQLTIASLSSGQINQSNIDIAYGGVRAAFTDYLTNYNHGRGIVFVGHSQGAMMLIGLLHFEVDPKPDIRKLMVSALLLGGNVTVPAGKNVGGDFANIPGCQSDAQTGCVVAYSSFETTPPQDAAFGRVGTSLGMFNFRAPGPLQILCVNPAAPDGGTAALKPYFPTVVVAGLAGAPKLPPTTPYVSYPNALTAQCKAEGGANWLQITRTGPPGSLPAFAGSEGPSWGLHDLDVNLALGNLVDLVNAQAAAYRG